MQTSTLPPWQRFSPAAHALLLHVPVLALHFIGGTHVKIAVSLVMLHWRSMSPTQRLAPWTVHTAQLGPWCREQSIGDMHVAIVAAANLLLHCWSVASVQKNAAGSATQSPSGALQR